MIDFLDKKIQEAKLNKCAIFFKQYDNFEVDWNYIINEINLSLQNEKVENLSKYFWTQEGGILMNHFLYFQIISEYPSRNKKINETVEYFSKIIYKNRFAKFQNPSVQYFINLVPFNKEMKRNANSQIHCDDWDVLFIQLIGESTWNIYLNQEDGTPIQSESIVPGDLIFIPKGVFHEIYAHTPRAGCSVPFL